MLLIAHLLLITTTKNPPNCVGPALIWNPVYHMSNISHIFVIYYITILGLCMWHSDKESACQRRRQKRQVWSLGQEVPWSRKWLPTPGFLPGKSHGQKSLVDMDMDRRVHGAPKSRTQLSNWTHTHISLNYYVYSLHMANSHMPVYSIYYICHYEWHITIHTLCSIYYMAIYYPWQLSIQNAREWSSKVALF